MDHYCAPQWVDFTSSPQVPCDDYFEKFHDIYESNICPDITQNNIKIRKKACDITETPNKSIKLQVKDFIKSIPNLNESYKTEIDNLKNTTIKVICPLKDSNGKHEVLKEVTYDNILVEAMQNFQFGANLQKVREEMDLSSTENIFKKPKLIKTTIAKPVQTGEIDTSGICISSNEEEIKKNGKSSNVDMIKHNKDSSIKITENDINISQIVDCTKSNEKNSTVKNDHSKMKIDNKNTKLKSSTVKQQTSVIRAVKSTKANTVDRFVTLHKQKEKEESKYKTMRKDRSKSTQLQHNSKDSSVSLEKIKQKNISLLSADSTVKEKRMQRSCTTNVKQEKPFYQKKTPFKKVISAVISNTASEIIIKREKILFFDIPVHSKQKKVTCPVPFSFENRDKIKKQLKLDQLSKSIKSESVTNTKSVSDSNKTQKHTNKFDNIARKGVTSFIGNRVTNEKNKNIKQPEQSKKVHASHIQPVTMRKPLRTINGVKGNNNEKNEDKIGKKKNEDIKNKEDINKSKNLLNSISCKSINSNKNSNIHTQAKGKLQINKYIPKENRQSNINVFTKGNNTLNQSKGVKLKCTIMKSSANNREKKNEFEERMRQRRIMHEEKLKKEKEAKLAKERLEIAKLRQQAEIKARPMPIYKPLIQIKSTKPLTQPQSPAQKNKHKVSMIKETS